MSRPRFLTLLLIVSLLLGGCTERREMNETNFVLGALFDYDAEKDKYEMYTQVAVSEAFSKMQSGGQLQETYLIYRGEADTVYGAVRDAARNSARRLFWSHCDVYVMGKDLAQKGILPFLDFAHRDHELRSTAYIFVSDIPREKLLSIKDGQEKVPLMALKRLVLLGPKRHGETIPKRVIEVWKDQSMENPVYLVPMLSMKQPETRAVEEKTKFEMAGAAVFREDKMVGRLSPQETRGYLFVSGQIKNAVFPLQVHGKKIAVELIGSKAKIIPHIEDGNVAFRIEVKPQFNFGENDQPLNLENQAFDKAAENAFNGAVEQEIRKSIEQAQQLKADYFNLAREVQLADNKLWQQIRNQWAEEIFPDLSIEVMVQSQLLRTGLLIETNLKGGRAEGE
ncbi:Ger(x)C family spore germination protein [Desulfotomaculum sp. 1211_IL3151]|uniref:Ger(x)C family spore germination protein n=1 Tax=Desulfotomaculum sp. 1211_IL3151 TaxID=3084055 RepID=UPI002FDA402C